MAGGSERTTRVRMLSGEERMLPAAGEVAGLLGVRARPWGPDGEAVSFSLRGLWACTAARRTFEEWAPATVTSLAFVEGTHFMSDPAGGADLHVAVHFGYQVFPSRTPARVMAARLIGRAVLEHWRTFGGAEDPFAAALLLEAAKDSARPAADRRRRVRTLGAGLREVAGPEGVPDALRLAVREVGGRRALTGSAEGAWSCTTTGLAADEWFRIAASEMGLEADADYVAEPEGGAAGTFVDAFLIGDMCSPETDDENAAAIAAAVEAAARTALAGKPARTEAALVVPAQPPAAEASEGDGEAWDEAFDFGRLVPVSDREIGGVEQPAVMARDVHQFLGVGRRFTTWYSDRAEVCSLNVGTDYEEVYSGSGRNPGGGRPSRDYVMTLMAAKTVAMTVGGSRGVAVRAYFMECERRLRTGEGPVPGTGTAPAARAVARVAAPPSCRPSMPEGRIPLTMAEFGALTGLAPPSQWLEAEAVALAGKLLEAGAGHLVRRHPADGRTVFDPGALDEWWQEAIGRRPAKYGHATKPIRLFSPAEWNGPDRDGPRR